MGKVILLLMLLPIVGIAQNKGTRFEHGLSWEQLKEKAQEDNKYLLVDCFTTWCVPCKYMTDNVFTQERVGDFFNKNFVNVKVQFDKTKKDSEEVRKWYADAEIMAKEFQIKAYPTFLVFSPQGQLVHRFVGVAEADEFIAKLKKALNPETQYYTLLQSVQADGSSPEALMELVNAGEAAYEKDKVLKYADAYLAAQTNLYTRTNLEFLIKWIRGSESKGFEILLKNSEKVDAVLGKGKAGEVLGKIILGEIFSKFDTVDDIDSLIAAEISKYPSIDIGERSSLFKIYFYVDKKKWDQYGNAVRSYMNRYGEKADTNLLDYLASGVFENCDVVDLIAEASKWSKRSVDQTQGKNANYLNTYANLLYKSGRKDEAIATQQKALNLAPAEKKTSYQKTLDKMKKGL